MEQRYIGFDVARAFAIFGMVIVNFKYLMHAWSGNQFLLTFTSLFQGRASVLFVVLAGVGVALLASRARKSHASTLISNVRTRLVKRGFFLVGLGLINSLIWQSDILHFYGVYFLIAAVLFDAKDQTLMINMALIIALFPIMMVFFGYGHSWDPSTLTYHDFWTAEGMIRSIIFNGVYPVFPWCSFLLLGMWLGRQDFTNIIFRKSLFTWSMVIWATTEFTFWAVKEVVGRWGLFNLRSGDVNYWFSTSFMPPLPQYVIAEGSLALAFILFCFHFSERLSGGRVVKWLSKVGQLSLTLYVMHLIVGVGLLKPVVYLGDQGISFSFFSAVAFCIFSILFSVLWLKHFEAGPLETVFRKVTS